MKNQNKPTPEELQEKIDSALELEDELTHNPNPDTEEESETEELPQKEEGSTDDIKEETEKESELPQKDEKEDQLKKKLSASARENQKIYAKNRVINQALVEADELPDPTEEELKTIYKDWDLMSEVEKDLAKETIVSKNWRRKISEAKEQATKIEKWNDAVNEFVEDPKTLIDNPDLEGKTDEFREFATTPEHNSVPFNVLVSAFLHDQQNIKASHKGKMFERSRGGSRDKPETKGDTITLEESRILRETDFQKWKEYLNAGKIQMDV